MPPHIVQPRKLLGARLRAHLVPWAWQDTRSFSLQLSDMRRVLMRLAFRVCVRAAEGDACSQTTAHTPCTQMGARRDALEICAHGVTTRAEMPCHSHSMGKEAAHAVRACADGDASFHDWQTHGHRQGMWGDDTAAYAAEDASMSQTTS